MVSRVDREMLDHNVSKRIGRSSPIADASSRRFNLWVDFSTAEVTDQVAVLNIEDSTDAV